MKILRNEHTILIFNDKALQFEHEKKSMINVLTSVIKCSVPVTADAKQYAIPP